MGTELSLPKKEAEPTPIFGPFLLWTNGWMDQDMLLGTEVGLSPGHIVLDGELGTHLPHSERGTGAPTFEPMSIMAKRLDGPRCHFFQG